MFTQCLLNTFRSSEGTPEGATSRGFGRKGGSSLPCGLTLPLGEYGPRRNLLGDCRSPTRPCGRDVGSCTRPPIQPVPAGGLDRGVRGFTYVISMGGSGLYRPPSAFGPLRPAGPAARARVDSFDPVEPPATALCMTTQSPWLGSLRLASLGCKPLQAGASALACRGQQPGICDLIPPIGWYVTKFGVGPQTAISFLCPSAVGGVTSCVVPSLPSRVAYVPIPAGSGGPKERSRRNAGSLQGLGNETTPFSRDSYIRFRPRQLPWPACV